MTTQNVQAQPLWTALPLAGSIAGIVACSTERQEKELPVIVVNTETIPGYTITRVQGMVQGNTVRAKHAGRDIAAGFKNLVGGELKGYTELLTDSRREALERMLAQAQELGANAVVNVRFSTSAVTAGAAELYAYGTAVTAEAAIAAPPPPLPPQQDA
ncbi:MAG: YbjQ family protein [Verrucomicrobia bacterium]|jgi:uncharacterized protein YbjQ (UPF0145 family)|nr:YbjQ family protein [Verrucomicrobiota bacterium]MBT7066012.1 YbjQ family protein [Verrucomicrobiota bacterium]